MSRWPAAWPRRVSPEAIGLARAYSFATFCRGRGRQAFPRAACVMLSIPVFLGGAVASRVCQSCGTGPPPYARRRARSEPSLLSVVERSPLGKSVLRFSSKGKINNRPPFCESIIRQFSLKLGQSGVIDAVSMKTRTKLYVRIISVLPNVWRRPNINKH